MIVEESVLLLVVTAADAVVLLPLFPLFPDEEEGVVVTVVEEVP